MKKRVIEPPMPKLCQASNPVLINIYLFDITYFFLNSWAGVFSAGEQTFEPKGRKDGPKGTIFI